jgi:hypothetical protein
MSGKEPRVSPLQWRRQLLIAESELNRAQLSEEWQTMTHALGDLAHRAKTIAAWAAAGALLANALAALRRRKLLPAQEKRSWFGTALKP